MDNLVDLLHAQADGIVTALGYDPLPGQITHATHPRFGHYQCNYALKLSHIHNTTPRDVAHTLVQAWHTPMIERLEVAGPGFINIFLSPQFLANELSALLSDPRLGVPPIKQKSRVIVEFSSPNIAKELHVGHLRSTIIGDALARLFEWLGHDVLRLNHIGDWGTQFGMLIAYMRDEVPKVLEKDIAADLPTLMDWYRASKQRFDSDPVFKKEAQLQVTKLQGGDEVSLAAWSTICDISRKAFEEIYRWLDISIIERGESFYNPYLATLITDLERKGLITVSGGAKCIFLEGYEGRDGKPLPIIMQKSDGGYNYDTTEMAALWHRIEVEHADRIIVVTDVGQSLHFEMIFAAAEKAGYLDRKRVRVDHVPFGVVLGPDGKKFKTRSGETEKLIDLLAEAVSLAKANMQARIPSLTEEELDQMSCVLGMDAVKYADLSSHRIKDYTFSYERMLRLEGNTAPFLLYAYVRMRSIQRKVGHDFSQDTSCIFLEHPTEISLALHLRQFGETLDSMAEELMPHRLADYLYLLAEKFHAFFRDCRVEGSDHERSRWLLCEAAARILRQGLHILGLKVLERM